jgi:hypothetical protein
MKEAGATRPRLVAFASTDCHTCLSRKRNCQRQRPYCSTWLDRGIKCGGYATALSWHESRTYISLNRQRYQQASGQMVPSQRRHKRADRRWNAQRLGNVHDCRFAESQKSTERSRTTTIPSQHPEPSSHDRYSIPSNHHSPNFLSGIPFIPGASADGTAEDFAGQTKDVLQDFFLMPIVQPTGSSPSRVQDLNDEQCLPQSHHEESVFLDVPEFVAEECSLSDLTACDRAFDTTNHTFGRIGMYADDIHLMLNPLDNTVLIPSSLDPTQKRKMLLKCCEYLHDNRVYFVALVVLRLTIVAQMIQIFVSCP